MLGAAVEKKEELEKAIEEQRAAARIETPPESKEGKGEAEGEAKGEEGEKEGRCPGM